MLKALILIFLCQEDFKVHNFKILIAGIILLLKRKTLEYNLFLPNFNIFKKLSDGHIRLLQRTLPQQIRTEIVTLVQLIHFL